MTVNWTNSSGGPFICGDELVLKHWLGHTENATSHYSQACDITGYTGTIEFNGMKILVLNDEPLQTALINRQTAFPLLVRWVYSSDNLATDQILDLPRNLDTSEVAHVSSITGEMACFDSAFSLKEANQYIVRFSLPVGKYLVETYIHKSQSYSFLFHEFKPVT
ncbi:MAG: hypothetical protein H7X92_03840 [Chitinophagales bacterium]|nr:hypothetical protein [Hyphomicrobiales bacterium]